MTRTCIPWAPSRGSCFLLGWEKQGFDLVAEKQDFDVVVLNPRLRPGRGRKQSGKKGKFIIALKTANDEGLYSVGCE